jgi:hypothetical protein
MEIKHEQKKHEWTWNLFYLGRQLDGVSPTKWQAIDAVYAASTLIAKFTHDELRRTMGDDYP